MTLGQIIYNYRKENGISQRKFADLCGNSISHGYICMLEKNTNPQTGKPIAPSMDVYRSIANAMRIGIDDLLGMLDSDTEISFEPADEKTEAINSIIDLAYRLPPDKLNIAQNLLKALSDTP